MSPIRAESAPLIGGLATIVGAIKVSQPHPWLYVLRHRPARCARRRDRRRVVIVAATVPLPGLALWFDWVAQLRLASDTTWDLGGFAIPGSCRPVSAWSSRSPVLVAVWFVPRERAGAWIGVLSVVGSLSLHIFGLLFLVPAMLLIRREAALLAAIFIATYSYEGAWAGIVICAVGMVRRGAGGACTRRSSRSRRPTHG